MGITIADLYFKEIKEVSVANGYKTVSIKSKLIIRLSTQKQRSRRHVKRTAQLVVCFVYHKKAGLKKHQNDRFPLQLMFYCARRKLFNPTHYLQKA